MIWTALVRILLAFFAVIGFFEVVYQVFLRFSRSKIPESYGFLVLRTDEKNLAEIDLLIQQIRYDCPPAYANIALYILPDTQEPLCLEACHVLAAKYENVRILQCEELLRYLSAHTA